MRLPLARDGWAEMLVLTTLCAVATWSAIVLLWWPVAAVPVLIGLWGIAFFRDPDRAIPEESGVLVSPADGKIFAVEAVDDCEWLGGPAKRIDIFLNVFNVHINRVPCTGTVAKVVRRGGKCLNALRPEASLHNVSCTVVLDPAADVTGPIATRQITGVLARRIVCHAKVGDRYDTGERFGMIKFGSRTELYLPAGDDWEILVQPGQTVRAGTTLMARYTPVDSQTMGERHGQAAEELAR